MKTTEDQTTAAVPSVDPVAWLEEFDSAFARIAGRFRRVEPRRQARAFLLAVLSDIDSRTRWQVAEAAGDRTPPRRRRVHGWKAALNSLEEFFPGRIPTNIQ